MGQDTTYCSAHPSPLPHSASLEGLLPEILLQIVTNLPSLDTLWNLLKASPRTWRLFGSYSLYITEGILSGPNSILPSRIGDLVRGVILARAGALPFQTLDEFYLRFMRGQIPWGENSDLKYISLGPETLSVSPVPVAILRSVVATADHLSALSQACLTSCLERLRDPSFQPMHAFDPEPHYTHDYEPVGDWVPAWDRVFTGRPVKMVDAGQPGWVEEMRALRAMWIIQLAGEVKHLMEGKLGILNWPEQDVERLSKMDAVDLVGNPAVTFIDKTEEVKTAMRYLTTLPSACSDTYYRLPRPPSSPRWVTALPKPTVRTLIRWGFRQNGRIHQLQEGSPIPEGAKPLNKAKFNDEFHWGQTEDALQAESCGVGQFRFITRAECPIRGVKFDFFRPLGFAFWDQQRMHLLGLAREIRTLRHDLAFYMYAWESILPPEEVVRLKAKLREARGRA